MQELKINAWHKQLKQNWKWPRMVNEHSDQSLFVSLKGMHLCSVSVLNRMSYYLHPEHLGKFLSLGSISSFGAGRNLGNKDQASSALLNQVLLTFWAGSSLLWGPSCTLQDVEQHPSSLPNRCQHLPLAPLLLVTTKNVSKLCQKSSGGNIVPHWELLL